MNKRDRKMKLGAFLYPTGQHIAAWRLPDVPSNAGLDIAHWVALAQTAERAKMDFIFLADSDGLRGGEEDMAALSRTPIRTVAQFEPLTLLSALSAVTQHIGLAATASTTYNEPYHLARKFASLDYLSHGRAGWNVVTSAAESTSRNFGRDKHVAHEARYRQAHEFVEVVKGLWDSWEDDAFPMDKKSGLYFDPAKLHVLGHKGEHFSVHGPLNVARPVQGYPVLIQAGASGPGRDLAAEIGEVIFAAQQVLPAARAFYADIKERAAKKGRDPEHVKVLPGAFLVIGRTETEAKEKFEEMQSLIHPEVGLSMLQDLTGVDFRGYPLDSPLPATLPDTNSQKSRQQLVLEMAHREKMTLRQTYLYAAAARGLWSVIGSPGQIADQMEDWFRNEAADGFNVMNTHYPGGLNDFVDLVLPELRRRGLFRTEYEGRTLRDNLGLPRPPHPALGSSAPRN